MRISRILVLSVVTLVPFFADGQSFYAIRRNRNLLVGLGSGTANYYGEMVNPGEFGILKPSISVSAEYYWTDRISTRAALTWFIISGDDSKADDDRKKRNLSFTSGNFELSGLGIINLTPLGTRFYQRPRINFHAFAGVGLLYFNPKAKLDGKKHALQPLQTEGVKYSRIVPVIPIGLGTRIKMDPFFNLLIEGGYRITFTDYLDDVSRARYLPESAFTDPTAYKLSDRRLPADRPTPDPTAAGRRGNPEKNDGYFILNVTVQYYMPKEIFRNSQRKLYKAKRRSYNRRR